MPATFHKIKNYPHELAWDSDNLLGYLPPLRDVETIYEESYWNKYQEYRGTDMAERLNNARLHFVFGNLLDSKKYSAQKHTICDVGIGSGEFVESLVEMAEDTIPVNNIKGTDINPYAIEWLKSRDLYTESVEHDIITMWDVLEHLEKPEEFITQTNAKFFFVSMPIYKSLDHVLSSKHLRPNEHLWYFTEESLVSMFKQLGYNLLMASDVESALGREDIGSFAFIKEDLV